ncbi:MAG: nucleotidyltransferase family protein [Actinobacteria bacterium]|nr:nucleotidyltransferase family protein [Actinomycetota bacterium]
MLDEQISDFSKNVITNTKKAIDEARRRGIVLRVLGGIAVLIHSHGDIGPKLLREVRDADLVVAKGQVNQLAKMLRELGYDENKRFNIMNFRERLIYFDPENKTQLDIFVGEFNMCHRLVFDSRLGIDEYTLPLAELVLTKLQIVQLNDKDLKDVLLLFLNHEVSSSIDEEIINSFAITKRCSEDWGLYKTVTDNLKLVLEKLPKFDLQQQDAEIVEIRINELLKTIEEQPKKARWKLRAAIGTKVRWYELPEEIVGTKDV